MATNDRNSFKKAFQSRTKGKWKKAKDAEATKQLSLPDGTYIARLTRCVFGVDKNQNPYVRFPFVIVSDNPDYDGQTGSRNHFLTNPKQATYEDGKKAKTLDDKMEDLAKDFQRLGIETSDKDDFDEVMEAADKLTKDKPYIKVAVMARIDRQTGKVDPTAEPLVFINGLAGDHELPDSEDNSSEDDDDDSTDDDADDSSDDDDTSSDEDDSDDGEGDEGDDSDDSTDDDTDPPDDYDDAEAEADDAGEEEEKKPAKKPDKKPTTKPAAKPAGKSSVVQGQKVTYKGALHTVKSVVQGKATLVAVKGGKLTRNVPVENLKK